MQDPEQLPLLKARRRAELEEAALVLRAVGIPHSFATLDGSAALIVSAPDAPAARHELERYALENPISPNPKPGEPARTLQAAWPGMLSYAVVLIGVFVAQHGSLTSTVGEQGRMDADRFLAGQWWRSLTALCLHIDVPHLAGNLVFGAAFGALLSQLLGNGLAWGAILLAGALGNTLDAWIQPTGHLSLGASTAVFSALGLLTSVSLRLRALLRDGPLRRWAPLVMGIALLGFLGTGGTRTNVLAHALGFGAGLALGALLAPTVKERAPGSRVQWLAALGSAALLAWAWTLAIST